MIFLYFFNILISGVIELHERHTALYLKEKVEELCAKFGIKRSQIYSATVDNGRNVVKAVDLMQEWATDDEDAENESLMVNIYAGKFYIIR